MAKSRCIFLALVLFFSGCDIFQTRTPEAPQQGQSGFIPPTLPSIVVENLASAIADRNVISYIACLSDNSSGRVFTFVPSPKAASQYDAIFRNWDRNSEQAYFNNLISYSSTSSSSALVLSSEQSVSLGPDSAYYSANYTLIWPNKGSGGLQQAQGNLQLYLGVNQSGNWSIYRWVDSGTGDSTWSDLKAQFSIPQ